MKRLFLVTAILVLCSLTVSAQKKVSYRTNAFMEEENAVSFSVTREDSTYFLVMTFESYNSVLPPEPALKMKTFDDEVLAFSGERLSQNSHTGGIGIGTAVGGSVVTNVIPYDWITELVRFKVTEEQFEAMASGVKKIRINTAPLVHEGEFRRDIIGKRLYKMFLEQKNVKDDF